MDERKFKKMNRRELLKHVDQLQKSAELDANSRAAVAVVRRTPARAWRRTSSGSGRASRTCRRSSRC